MVCQGYLRCSGRYPLLSTQVISRHACATKSSLHAVPASVIAILVTNCRLRESKFQAAPSGRAKIDYSTDYLQIFWWFSQMTTRQDHHHEPASRVSWSRAYIFIDQTVYQCMYYIYQTRCPSDKHACLGGTPCSIYTWFSRNPSARVYDINYTVIIYPGSNVAGSPVALGSCPQNGCYSFLGHCGLDYLTHCPGYGCTKSS